jgi:hypothetical protein
MGMKNDLTPALSKGEGAKNFSMPIKVLSFGEDLGEVLRPGFPQKP